MRLSRAIARWMFVDLGGLALLLLGGLWLAVDVAIVPGFPSGRVQAWFCVVVGLTLIAYAVIEMLKEFLTQRPVTPGGHDPAADG
jgi:uncharacterized membrane protein YczE